MAYQSHLTSKGFEPINTLDPAQRASDKLYSQLERGEEYRHQNELSRIQSEEDNSIWKSLGAFSQKATEIALVQKKKQDEKAFAIGLQKGYAEGFSKDAVIDFEKTEKQIKDADLSIQQTATSYQKKGYSQEVVDKIKSMSPWEAYGYATALAQNAGADYEGYLDEQLSTNNSLQIDLTAQGGRVFTPATAETNAEKAAAIAALREQYFVESGLIELNPILVNKYAFDDIRKVDNAIMRDTRKQNLIEASLVNQQDALKKLETTGDLAATLETLQNTVNENGKPLGMSGAWDLIDEHIKARAEVGNISLAELEALKQGKPTHAKEGQTFGSMFKTKFDRWEEIIKENKFSDEENRKKIAAQDFVLEMQAAQEEKGSPLTLEERKQWIAKWDYKNGDVPVEVKNFLVEEDADQDIAVARLQYKLTNNMPIFIEDLKGIYDSDTYRYWKGEVDKSSAYAIPEKYMSFAKAQITSATNDLITGQEGKPEKSEAWNNVYQQAERSYQSYYAEAIRVEKDPWQAHLTAIDRVKADIKNKAYSQQLTASADQTHEKNLKLANRSIELDQAIIKTKVIPGTEEALERARENPNEVQLIYTQIAENYKEFNGFDLQQMQLEAIGEKPIVSVIEEQVSKLDPKVQELLKNHPTPARVKRAKIEAYMEDGDISYEDIEHVLVLTEEEQAQTYTGEDGVTVPTLGQLTVRKGDWKKLPGAIGYVVWDGKEWVRKGNKGKFKNEYIGNVENYKDIDNYYKPYPGVDKSTDDTPLGSWKQLPGAIGYVVWNGKEWVRSGNKGPVKEEFEGTVESYKDLDNTTKLLR